jgi:PAS domain S-box-containing protein
MIAPHDSLPEPGPVADCEQELPPDDKAVASEHGTTLTELVHHRRAVSSDLSLSEVHKAFNNCPHDFFAVTEAGRVVGLCSRATVGFMLGSRYGFALYGNNPVWTARAPRPLIYACDTPLQRVLDETFSRSGSEFFEDVVLVHADGSLAGLVPVPALASLQTRLFGEQVRQLVVQDAELRQQNLELFQVNQQLRQSQGRYNALFENNALGVALLDRTGTIIAHNRRFEHLLRLAERPATGTWQLDRWVPEPERAALRHLLAWHEEHAPDAEPRVTEFHFEFGETARLFELHSSWVAETGQICMFLEDITDQRALEQSMARQEKQNMLDSLVAGVAHELNNKLTPVLGFADLLQKIAPAPLQTHTKCIQQSAREAALIISQLLTLSRPAGQGRDLLDLATVCREVLQVLRFQLREASCEANFQPPAAPVNVFGDAAQLKQVLINLVLNALHAMEGRPAPRLIVSVRADGATAWLRVRDFGTGIKPEHLNRIFDPFFTTKGPRGTGLGLSISASLIHQHGGEITAESTPGEGATFTIRLPLSNSMPTKSSIEESPQTAAPPAPADARRWRMLVVDDEEFVRQFMQEALRLCFNCTVDSANDGLDAIEKLRANHYDLIVSDIRMPRMDGLQFRRWLAEHQPASVGAFVFVTGHAGAVEVDQALGLLPCPVIRKPFTIDAIRATCGAVLERSASA